MLADYQVAQHTFDLQGGSFSVSGLALDQIEVLVRTHLPDLEALFELFANIEHIQEGDLNKIASAVVSQAPGFAANLIALAAGEPHAAPVAQKMPGPLQIEILIKIGDLTFAEVGGVKKFLPTVANLFGVADLQKKVKTVVTRKKKAG